MTMRRCEEEHYRFDPGVHWHFESWEGLIRAVENSPLGSVRDSDFDVVTNVRLDLQADDETEPYEVRYMRWERWRDRGDRAATETYWASTCITFIAYDEFIDAEPPSQQEVDEALASILRTYEQG